jgi:small subunit ribosomal protein S2
MQINVGVKELLEAGVHFGHQTRRWNPKMKPFIFEARNGIYIIDLSKTATQLQAACDFLSKTVADGGQVLFVGTKKQAQQAVKEVAKDCGQLFVIERWLGGTLTNYTTIKKSLARLRELEKWDADGSINNYVKQEQAVLRRERERLVKYFDGIRAMDRLPAAMFVVDIKREHNAVAEARRLNIPVVALVDTNADPDLVQYPIAGNDDAIRSVRLVLATISQVIMQARAEFETKASRRKKVDQNEPAAAPAPVPTPAPAPAPKAEEPAAPAAPKTGDSLLEVTATGTSV